MLRVPTRIIISAGWLVRLGVGLGLDLGKPRVSLNGWNYNRVTLAKKGVQSITTVVAEALGLWWMERTTVQGTGLESCS